MGRHAGVAHRFRMKQSYLFIWLVALAALFASGLAGPGAFALAAERDPEIGRIVLSGDEGRLVLSASVRNALNSRLRRDLAEDGELNFVFSVELLRKGSWFDDSLRKFSLTHSLRRDQEKGDYVFTPEGGEPRRTASLREAEEWMAGFSRVPVAELAALTADAPYAIRIQAVLRRGLPVLGRLGAAFGGIQTARRTIEFRY